MLLKGVTLPFSTSGVVVGYIMCWGDIGCCIELLGFLGVSKYFPQVSSESKESNWFESSSIDLGFCDSKGNSTELSPIHSSSGRLTHIDLSCFSFIDDNVRREGQPSSLVLRPAFSSAPSSRLVYPFKGFALMFGYGRLL